MGTIILAGGGTGGHVYPAISIGDVLRERGHQVLYYGDPDRIEARVAPGAGYEFRPVRALQYPRGGLVGKVKFAIGLFRSILATRAQLKRDDADVVLGVGGYISAPPVLAAWTLGIRRLIHEANAVPGMANKLCARVANTILMTYEKSRDRFPGSAPRHLVGVPVNPKILGGDRTESAAKYGLQPEKPTILFVGGSLGAARINELAIACATLDDRDFQVLHLCGKRYHDEVREALGDPRDGVRLVDYEDRMADAYALADLIVCRCGSSTLGEICAVGIPGLLIPSPNVTENHQEENARSLEDAGAATVLVEAEWNIDSAVDTVTALIVDTERLNQMAANAKRQARLDAASLAADRVEELLPRR